MNLMISRLWNMVNKFYPESEQEDEIKTILMEIIDQLDSLDQGKKDK